MSEWKIEHQDETEVYITKTGMIGIRQEDAIGNPESAIAIPRHMLDRFISYLQAAAAEIDAEGGPDAFGDDSTEEPQQ